MVQNMPKKDRCYSEHCVSNEVRHTNITEGFLQTLMETIKGVLNREESSELTVRHIQIGLNLHKYLQMQRLVPKIFLVFPQS